MQRPSGDDCRYNKAMPFYTQLIEQLLYTWRWTRARFRKPISWVRLLYVVSLATVFIVWRTFWTPDLLFIALFIGFWLWGQGKQFFTQFTPFIALLLSYDGLRSLASYLNSHVHYVFMAHFDQRLFGVLPTAWLQQYLYHGHLQWYDFYFYGLYMVHFIVPLVLAIILWKKRPGGYAQFITALLILSYAGFLTYILYPAAPPWLASQLHLITPIHRISSDVWWAMGIHNFPSLYRHLAPNEVAAVPSLHAAYPTLVWLFTYTYFDKKLAAIFLLYPISVCVGVVYLGEHYVFDVLLGIAYAVVSFVFTRWIFALLARRRDVRPAKTSPSTVS